MEIERVQLDAAVLRLFIGYRVRFGSREGKHDHPQILLPALEAPHPVRLLLLVELHVAEG